jgi:DNA-binding GntR family transcriptional regulator
LTQDGKTFRRSKRIDTEAIFETIRKRISTLDYPPGSILREIDLAREFSASRTPIRQVLQRLELSGLIHPVVGLGSVVAPIDVVAMRHVYAFREHLAGMLEPFLDLSDRDALAGELAALEALQRSLDPRRNYAEMAEVSHAMRLLIAKRITNPFVAQTWIDTYFLASRWWFTGFNRARTELARRQLEEIIDLRRAVSSGRRRKVAQALSRHIREFGRAMLARSR